MNIFLLFFSAEIWKRLYGIPYRRPKLLHMFNHGNLVTRRNYCPI